MTISFLFDPNRCTGCHACRLACTIENGLGPAESWRRIETFNPRRHPGAPVFHLSTACNHCAEPACLHACPARAITRDEGTGAILLDSEKCIGCRYCAWACPYGAPVFDDARGVMTKCTYCHHRLQEGRKPACAALCPTGALDLEDLPAEFRIQDLAGFPATDLDPALRIFALKPERRRPDLAPSAPTDPFLPPAPRNASEISLRSEWSLALFTLAAALLVALVAAALVRPLPIRPGVFLFAAVLTLGIGTLHLGHPRRAWRAVLHPGRSWLSREILLLSASFSLAAIYFAAAPEAQAVGWAAALIGFAGLFCADRVCGVLGTRELGLQHSADVFWTGCFLTGVLTGNPWGAGLVGSGKLLLYLHRKIGFRRAGRPVRPLSSAARTGVGFLAPLGFWLLGPAELQGLVIVGVVIGEMIDRSEFYAELETTSPARLMDQDLRKLVRRG